MKRWMTAMLAILMVLAVASLAGAEDRMLKFPVKHALNSKLAKERLVEGVPVYMSGQGHPGVKSRGRAYKSNKRGNSANKNDQNACDSAFISAIIALQERADREGHNAVIDIYSVTKNRKHHSAETYTCNAGSMIANVVLMGTVVTIGR